MKRIVKTCVAAGSRMTGLVRAEEKSAAGTLTILCYHRVLPAEQKAAYPYPDLVVTPRSFRRHCLTLKRTYKILPLREAVRQLRRASPGPRPLAAITFDDGYRDNFVYALPTLNQLDLRATFFVIAGLVGTDQVPWYDLLGRALLTLDRTELEALVREASRKFGRRIPRQTARHPTPELKYLTELAKQLPRNERARLIDEVFDRAPPVSQASPNDLIMDWTQLTHLRELGHEIGSHSLTHEILPFLEEHALQAELVESRNIIEKNLDCRAYSFCYPNGDLDRSVAQQVMAAGYGCAVTTVNGTNEPGTDVYRLRRRFIHEERLMGLYHRPSSTLLRMELCGLADRVFKRQKWIPQRT